MIEILESDSNVLVDLSGDLMPAVSVLVDCASTNPMWPGNRPLNQLDHTPESSIANVELGAQSAIGVAVGSYSRLVPPP